MSLTQDIQACQICATRFAKTATAHTPRPVVWFQNAPRIVIAGQAPGARVHASGRPFTDPSGDRLRDWMGINEATFYDISKIAIVPMAFCFPGYNAAGHDLAPPKICADTWRAQVMDAVGQPPLTLLIGAYAQKWHLGGTKPVNTRVMAWRDHAPRVFPLPHPSWRNTAWLNKNPWFAADLLPALRTAVKDALNMTDLDTAHATMDASPDDDAKRLQFYERLADTELFMLLGAEADGDKVTPEIFEIEDQQYILIFDREERLAQFVGREAPYAGLSGRVLSGMVAGQGIGFALNLDVAPSAMLIPADAVDWLHATLEHSPQEAQARLTEVSSPKGLPEAVITGLDRKLAIAAGLANIAYLAAATYDDTSRGHVLVFIDAVPGSEAALARAAGEALTFSGIEAGTMDVMFARGSDQLATHLAKVGLRFDLPALHDPKAPGAPGMDPDNPPKLR